MSIIQGIRDKGAWIVFGIIALALIAFIMQDAAFRRGGLFSNSNVIGKVNGQNITRTQFDDEIALIKDRVGPDRNIPNAQLIPGVWNELVQKVLLNQQYKKLGLALTPNDLDDILFGANPPQWLRVAFTDQNTGVFDINKARAYFASLKSQRNSKEAMKIFTVYIQPEIDQRLFQNYQQLISASNYCPSWLARKMTTDNTMDNNIQYISIPYKSLNMNNISVTDQEIKDYEEKHPASFQQTDETRSILYTTFNASPNSDDSLSILAHVNELKTGFIETKNSELYLDRVGTETPYTGVYEFNKKISTQYSPAILKLPIGQVYGPFVEAGNYSIVKVIGKKDIPDSVVCRHILIKTMSNGEAVLDDSIAKKRIDSIVRAIQKGASFDQLALQYSDDPGSKNKGGIYHFSYSQFSNLSKEFAETIFYDKVGTGKIVKVNNGAYSGYHYIQVLSQKNIAPATQLAVLSKSILASQATDNSASAAAANFASTITDVNSFYTACQKIHTFPLSASDIKKEDFVINGLGEKRDFIRWIYDNPVGTVSDPIEFPNIYAVAIITEDNPKGLYSVTKARPYAQSYIENDKKAKIIVETKIKGTSLSDIATSSGQSVQQADKVSFASPFIPVIGNEPKVVGITFNKNYTNKVTPPIIGNTGVFVIQANKPAGNKVIDENTMLMQKKMVESQITGYQSAFLQNLQNAADIKNYLSEFY
ncbi:MAG: SurA N-terminal domain-containing protein [Phycisphaerales bacterium]|nr:SurA N-terminal domain-containing protein [Phycisphaerales bacterium]